MLTQQFYFFNTLLELHSQLTSQCASSSQTEAADAPIFSADFRDFIFQKNGKTLESLKMMAPYFLRAACRPFQLLYDDPEFYIVFDCTSYTYYACFRKLTMIDVDIFDEKTKKSTANTPKEDITTTGHDAEGDRAKHAEKVLDSCSEYLEWLVQECEVHRDWRFAIYRSRNGLHVFPLHRYFMDNRDERAEFQLSLKCDFYYSLFCYLRRGCSIRLNPKPDEITADRGGSIYQFVGFLGHGETIPELLALVELHIDLTDLFRSAPTLAKEAEEAEEKEINGRNS